MRLAVRRGKIRNKIIIWSLSPTAAILVLVALTSFFTYQRVTEELVFERDQELTALSAGQVALELSQEPDLLPLVRAWDIYKTDPTFVPSLIDRVSGVVRLRSGQAGNTYLVDGNGRVVYHTDPRQIGADFSSQVAVQEVLRGRAGATRTHDFQGREIVASFSPLPGTSWGLVNEESWAAVSSAGQTYRQFLILLLVLALLAPAVVILASVRRITRPIAKMVDAAQGIAEGNFDQRITVLSGDELEELAEQFNRMAFKLQESYAHLELRVADRTRELEALNAISSSVSESLDLDVTLNRTLDRILSLLDLEVGEIRLWDERAAHLVIRTQRGLSPEYVRLTDRCRPEETLAGEVALSGEPLVLESIVAGSQDGRLQREGLRAIAVFPLRVKDNVLGTLSLATRRGPRRFTAERRQLLRAVSDQVGLAVDNARLYEEARQRAVVEERNRLARELHDSVTQALYGVTLYAEAAARVLASGEVGLAIDHLQELRNTAQESLREMRLLVFELRPPLLQQEGLVAALQARLEAVEGRGGIETEFNVEGTCRLPTEAEESFYRIAQEALNNALRHARAQHIKLNLCVNSGCASLEVIDDGVGFDVAAAQEHGGLGLCGMRERAAQIGGRLSVQSGPEAGTCVRVEVDL